MIHVPGQTPKPRVFVILGSTRRGRICEKVGAWIADIGRDALDAAFEIIDLRQWPLPMDDEPGIPALGHYANAHTQAWSQKIAEADAFVFVTPQYNWGYPAPLKNALDHLYREWRGKPAMIVTYGGHGGDKCAAQLRQVLQGLNMAPVKTMPGLLLARALIEANDGAVEPARDFAGSLKLVRRAFKELANQTSRTA